MIDYFVNYLEAWRAELKLSGFFLTGQSLGAYLVGCYAVKHHNHIRKLVLLTPPGIGQPPAKGKCRNWKDFLESEYKPSRFVELIA